MKQLLLVFNLLLLATSPNNLFCAHAGEPAAKNQFDQSNISFDLSYFTEQERKEVNELCALNNVSFFPHEGADQKTPDESFLCIKAYNKEAFIGFMVLQEAEEAFKGGIEITHLFINADYQRKGIGKACMQHMFSLFPEIPFFTLWSVRSAINFYEKFGFKSEQPLFRDGFMVKKCTPEKSQGFSDKPTILATNKGCLISIKSGPFSQEERIAAAQILFPYSCFLREPTASDTCIKFYNDNTFIGFMLLNSNSSKAGEKYISQFFIDSKFQNRGIGSAVFEHVQRHIFPEVNFFRLDALTSAIPFYERLGFKRKSKYHIAMTWGRPSLNLKMEY